MRPTKLFLIAIAVALSAGTPVPAWAEAPKAIAPSHAAALADREAIRELARALAFLAPRAERLWPGFKLGAIPLVFHRPGGPAYLLQHPAPLPPGFAALPGQPAIALQPSNSRFPHGIDTEFRLGAREVVTVSLESDMSWPQSLLTAIHEAFHQHQHGRRFAHRGSSTDLGVHSARDMALAEAEQQLLADALTHPERAQASARMFVKMFLAVRETRHLAVPAAMHATEETLETLEGTANYVEQRVRILADQERKPFAFARSQADLFNDLAQFLRHPLDQTNFARARYYKTGAAMGFLLDRWSQDWPRRVEAGQTPSELLAQATGYQSAQRSSLLAAVEARFDLKAATARHQALFDQMRAQQEAALAAFVRQPGRRVEVEIAFAHGGISVSSQGLSFPLEDDAEFNEEATISLETPGGTTVLLMGRILSGHVLEGEDGFYKYTLYLPLRHEQVLLNGRPLPTAPGRYEGALRWTSERATVVSPKATVEVAPGRIRVRV